jgi:outer membrane receptor for ferrienterochelin and colicin
LEPERGWGGDVGVAFGDRTEHGVELRFTYFHRWIDDLIEKTTVLDGTDYYSMPTNTGDGEVWGEEAALWHDAGWAVPGAAVWLSGALLDSEVEDSTTGKTRRMKEQSKWVAALGVDQFFAPLSLTAGVALTFKGESENQDGTKDEVEEEYWQLDAYLRWRPAKMFEISAGVTNLNDVVKTKDSVNTANGDRTHKTEEADPSFTFAATLYW